MICTPSLFRVVLLRFLGEGATAKNVCARHLKTHDVPACCKPAARNSTGQQRGWRFAAVAAPRSSPHNHCGATPVFHRLLKHTHYVPPAARNSTGQQRWFATEAAPLSSPHHHHGATPVFRPQLLQRLRSPRRLYGRTPPIAAVKQGEARGVSMHSASCMPIAVMSCRWLPPRERKAQPTRLHALLIMTFCFSRTIRRKTEMESS